MKRTVRKFTRGTSPRPRLPISAAERRRLEAELRATEEHIALSALDALSADLDILDSQGNILASNKAWREFAGRKQTEHGRAGQNYFKHCGEIEDGAGHFTKFSDGVRVVLDGVRMEFDMEYACEEIGRAHV